MVKYVILVIFLIVLIVTIYILNAFLWNNKLNRKKSQLGERNTKNKYLNYTRFSAVLSLVIGGVLIFAFIYKSPIEGIINRLNSVEEYDQIINESKVDLGIQNIDKAVEVDKLDLAVQNVELEDGVIVSTNEQLVKYNKKMEEINKITLKNKSKSNGVMLYENKVIAYNVFDEYSDIYLYDVNALELLEYIKVNAEIINININGNNLDVITYSDIQNELQYNFDDFINEEYQDKLVYNEIEYMVGSIHKKLMCHTKINLRNKSVKQYGLCLSDLYYLFDERTILCTNIVNRYSVNTTVVLDYDVKNMSMDASNVISGRIYYNPSIEQESIYINSYLKEEDFVVYTLDDQLEVVDINEEVSRKDITKFYKIRNCFISFEEGQIKTYNFLEHKMEIIEFPIKVDDVKISDYVILDGKMYIITQEQDRVILFEIDINIRDVKYEILDNNNHYFFTEDGMVEITQDGEYNKIILEEIGN